MSRAGAVRRPSHENSCRKVPGRSRGNTRLIWPSNERVRRTVTRKSWRNSVSRLPRSPGSFATRILRRAWWMCRAPISASTVGRRSVPGDETTAGECAELPKRHAIESLRTRLDTRTALDDGHQRRRRPLRSRAGPIRVITLGKRLPGVARLGSRARPDSIRRRAIVLFRSSRTSSSDPDVSVSTCGEQSSHANDRRKRLHEADHRADPRQSSPAR